jgi:hypothetical protein
VFLPARSAGPDPLEILMTSRRTALGLAVAAGAASVAGAGINSFASADTSAAAVKTVHLQLKPSSPELASCFPKAHAHVAVDLTTDAIGKDTFRLTAENLKPRTTFTVFLIKKAASPFGAAEYIGDVTTGAKGNGSATFKLIVEEAFAFNNRSGARTDLNSIGMWFADPKDDNGCLGAGSPVTGFDGDASAGVQMLNSGARKLP